MGRKAAKQAPQKFEEPDEAEGWEDAVVDTDAKDAEADLRMRDWRDVERYREMKELRSLVDDDYGLAEIFHVPMRPRPEPGIPGKHSSGKPPKGAPAKGAPAPAPAAKGAPAKAAPPAKPAPGKPAVKGAAPAAAAKPQAKAAPKSAAKVVTKVIAKLKAKAKKK